MSDYIYHPRKKMPAATWNNVYYSTNPYINIGYMMQYAWGRFWEIIDLYAEYPDSSKPTKLGYIEVQDVQHGITNLQYLGSNYWVYAGAWTQPDVISFANTDTFGRYGIPELGSIAVYSSADQSIGIVGIVEEMFSDPDDYKISLVTNNQTFHYIRVDENDTFELNGINFNMSASWANFIENPIYINYTHVISGGKPMEWNSKLLYYIKRKLQLQREEIFG